MAQGYDDDDDDDNNDNDNVDDDVYGSIVIGSISMDF